MCEILLILLKVRLIGKDIKNFIKSVGGVANGYR